MAVCYGLLLLPPPDHNVPALALPAWIQLVKCQSCAEHRETTLNRLKERVEFVFNTLTNKKIYNFSY